MIRDSGFWNSKGGEVESPIWRRNGRFITQENYIEHLARMQEWMHCPRIKEVMEKIDIEKWEKFKIKFTKENMASTNAKDQENETADDIPESIQRIFKMDAERTFDSPKFRNLMVQVLKGLYLEIQDYHQGLAFIVAFLLLFFSPEDTYILVLAFHFLILEGYFKAAPVEYVRDSRVFMLFLEEHKPHLADKIESFIPAEAFCSKWFIGLAIHVLTFEAEILFLEKLLFECVTARFQFGLALCDVCEVDLMTAKGPSALLEILRLDPLRYPNDYTLPEEKGDESHCGNFFVKIIDTMIKFDLSLESLEKYRIEASEKMQKEAEWRKKRELEMEEEDSDEIFDSDEE